MVACLEVDEGREEIEEACEGGGDGAETCMVWATSSGDIERRRDIEIGVSGGGARRIAL